MLFSFQANLPFRGFNNGRWLPLVRRTGPAEAVHAALRAQGITRLVVAHSAAMAAAADRVLVLRDGVLTELQRTAEGQPDGTQALPVTERTGPEWSGHNQATVE